MAAIKQEHFYIGHIPALLLGEKQEKIYLFIHGQKGRKEEAIPFAEIALSKGWQVLSIDLPQHGERKDDVPLFPWMVIPELERVMDYLKASWERIALRGNSIGAWLALLSFPNKAFEKALLVSPVLDMPQLIRTMMGWASVTEEQLERAGEIETDFGQTLSWSYFLYTCRHAIGKIDFPAEILYGAKDSLVSRSSIEAFLSENQGGLTVMAEGEHWFHTKDQLAFMKAWEEQFC